MNVATWSRTIAALATAGVITRTFDWPEAIWAVSGAVPGGVLQLLPVPLAFDAVGKGADVYLCLTGMMLLSKVGRREGLFDAAACWPSTIRRNCRDGTPAWRSPMHR